MDVTVWWLPLLELEVDVGQWLSAPERERMAGYRHEDDRLRFRLGAELARAAVAHSVGMRINEVALDRRCAQCGGPHRPQRAGPPRAPHLSITHAGGLVGVATSSDGPVGLDVEPLGDG